ncbi:HD-GYP domain-containing protein [Marinobacterium sediminicola]|uniref:HD domain-containing protein n=1 Tax=Marinobacterium sediminicola TaxID=518898 RepID=A0ABY1S1Y2_9GAMM|nr:HD-GYP domain-containing protein [Marinobacterium sediminicola]ULG69383.1 HD domain-containing protein [Marinobacterium sediminicola]SMR75530.1 HD domain-containing protein [Marinobacterium sediminicola]
MERWSTTRYSGLKLSELISALSHALDMTEGQPPGHCVRCCWIGMQLAEPLGLDADARWELYYTLLLKDLGCSSNAARICELYGTDDLSFKRDFKWVNGSLGQVVSFLLRHTGRDQGIAEQFKRLLRVVRDGKTLATELTRTRCERGAAIARDLGFSEAVASGIHSLDEHWSGSGRPEGLAGDAIPLYARIALLAQVVDVFYTAAGPEAALTEARERRGHWFDPELVDALERVAARPDFWSSLASDDLMEQILTLPPADHEWLVDDDCLDRIAAAFGQVVDAKSPYTAGHSERVALYTDLIAVQLGLPDERRRWLRRGALLHDIGKLGVSNSILDKPGKLDEDEWRQVQNHARFTEEILSRIAAFAELSQVAGAHHERMDGKGYPRGLKDEQISLETRIITTADIFDAITAERPYRGAIPVPRALEMMAENLHSAIDLRCFEALQQALERVATGEQEGVLALID